VHSGLESGRWSTDLRRTLHSLRYTKGMDILTSMPFLGGAPPSGPEALGRFLPPVPEGIARAWLSQHVPASGWVLDPFGTSPRLVAEAVRTGRRVLVAANNPVTRFLVELAASPPAQADFQRALAELSASRKGDDRLEQHILSLYETDCATCHRPVSADAFVWDAHSGIITHRIYTCLHCGDSGEREATPADIERSAGFAAGDSMQRARVLARVAPPDDPDRPHAEEALQLYLPRAIYALGTLINRLDQLTLPPARRQALHALLLQACDASSALWSHGPERARPRSLQLPGTFRENNVWRALEEAFRLWAEGAVPVSITVWPELPPETGGLCIFEGALRDLRPKLDEIAFAAALGVLPRPNQAFWTLSALWAGWLWGRESAAPFKSVLRRRRYDWQWHAEALRAALGSLAELLQPGTPFFALIAEAEPPFVSAALSAASNAGFALKGVAMRAAGDPLQLLWQVGEKPPATVRAFDRAIIQSALRSFLDLRAEPVTYLHAYVAGSAALADANALPLTGEVNNEAATAVQQVLEDPLFIRYRARSSDESGFWGLASPGEEFVPLSDRVEMAVVRYLRSNPNCVPSELSAELHRQFPGLLTPPLALVGAALASYALREEGRAGSLRLRDEDSPSARRAEMGDLQTLLEEMGKRLDYHVLRQEGGLVIWESELDTATVFFVQASAVTERVLRSSKYPPGKTVLVIPGGRAGLMAYKLRRDPYLNERLHGWRYLKFRHLRQMGEAALLSRDTWEEQLTNDPIESAGGQMLMF